MFSAGLQRVLVGSCVAMSPPKGVGLETFSTDVCDFHHVNRIGTVLSVHLRITEKGETRWRRQWKQLPDEGRALSLYLLLPGVTT